MKVLKIKLHWQILIALVLAVFFGYYVPQGIKYTERMGSIFLTALKMVIVPLILSSIISGVTSMGGGKNLGRLGGKTLFYYVCTSLLAIITGLVLVNIIRPGVGVEMGFTNNVVDLTDKASSVKDILMRIVPSNIFNSMAEGDILPVIFFAIIFGVFISQVDSKYSKTLTNFFEGVFEVMMKMTLFIIKFTPLGVFGIVSREVHRNADQLGNLAGSMAIYMFTVVLALSIHAFITLPLIRMCCSYVYCAGLWHRFKHCRATFNCSYSLAGFNWCGRNSNGRIGNAYCSINCSRTAFGRNRADSCSRFTFGYDQDYRKCME